MHPRSQLSGILNSGTQTGATRDGIPIPDTFKGHITYTLVCFRHSTVKLSYEGTRYTDSCISGVHIFHMLLVVGSSDIHSRNSWCSEGEAARLAPCMNRDRDQEGYGLTWAVTPASDEWAVDIQRRSGSWNGNWGPLPRVVGLRERQAVGC